MPTQTRRKHHPPFREPTEPPLRRVVFIHIPKTAGSSIIKWGELHSKQYNFIFDHDGHSTFQELCGKDIGTNNEIPPLSKYTHIDPYIVFAVRRNTYDRMISLFNHVCYQNENTQDFQELLASQSHEKGICYFIEYLNNNPKFINSRFNRSLIDWCKGVNIVLNYENLRSQFKIIKDMLAVTEPLKRHNVLPYKYDKNNYYTQEYIDVIQKYYGEELEKYKYLPKKCLTS